MNKNKMNNALQLSFALKQVNVRQKRSKCLKWLLLVDLLSRATVFWGQSHFYRVKKKLLFQKLKTNTMLVFFFDTKGIVHKEFVFQSTTVNALFYQNGLSHLCKKIARVKSEIVHFSSCTKTYQRILR